MSTRATVEQLPLIVTDPVFEAAVDRYLEKKASDAEIAMLETDPHLWKKALAARIVFLQSILATTTGEQKQVVEVIENHAISYFIQKVKGLNRGAVLRELRLLQIGCQRAGVLIQERAATSQNAARYAAERLLYQLQQTLPSNHPGHGWIAEYCEAYRNGYSLSAPKKTT